MRSRRAREHALDAIDVRAERAVVVERLDPFARATVDGARAGAERVGRCAAKIDRLRGDDAFDRDDVAGAHRPSPRVFSTVPSVIGAWSSMRSATGRKSSEPGFARSRISLHSAVSVFCTVAKPDSAGPWRVNWSGSPVIAGDMNLMQRSTASEVVCASAIAAASKASASAGTWKFPVDSISP